MEADTRSVAGVPIVPLAATPNRLMTMPERSLRIEPLDGYAPAIGRLVGMLTYGAGTLTESLTTLTGWHEPVFRAWYITGALLGGAPLAQGTVYLLMKRRTANRLTVVVASIVVIAATCVILSPINYAGVEPYKLTGKVLEWHWVRMFSPFINLYAVTFLIGGAIFSAFRYKRQRETYHRYVGNLLIAVGALLPGIGGTFTRFGHTEVLYVTELIGLMFIYAGFKFNTAPSAASIPVAIAA